MGTYSGQPLAFSSAIDGSTYAPVIDGSSFSFQTTSFSGIMGGLSADLFTTGTSPIRFLGTSEWIRNAATGKASISKADITSYIPVTSAFTGSYQGFLSIAADFDNGISGDVRALCYQPSGYGGYGGILYSDDIAGSDDPETGSWKAYEGISHVYQMSQFLSSPDITIQEFTKTYAAGVVPVDVISGGMVDLRTSQTTIQQFPGAHWGIWRRIFGGTYTGGPPRNWISEEVNKPLPEQWAGGRISEYLHFKLDAPVNGVSSGTVVGAESRWGEKTTAESTPEFHTVVIGGAVKGIFDPATTPLTWTAIAQGGFMRTENFIEKQSGMTDSERANFERATKIPAFDVGMANLRGNNGNLYVNMDNIKFFRFQNEADPRLWATNNVYGSYTSNPSADATVTLSSSGNLTGLTQTFEVKQWDTTNNGWGASIYKGASDTAGTLTRTETRTLPAGASATIPIAAMPGTAAGSITPGVNATGLPGTGSFSGTAAGVVKVSTGGGGIGGY